MYVKTGKTFTQVWNEKNLAGEVRYICKVEKRVVNFTLSKALNFFLASDNTCHSDDKSSARKLRKQFGPNSGPGPEVKKLFSCSNSAEHKIYLAHKC